MGGQASKTSLIARPAAYPITRVDKHGTWVLVWEASRPRESSSRGGTLPGVSPRVHGQGQGPPTGARRLQSISAWTHTVPTKSPRKLRRRSLLEELHTCLGASTKPKFTQSPLRCKAGESVRVYKRHPKLCQTSSSIVDPQSVRHKISLAATAAWIKQGRTQKQVRFESDDSTLASALGAFQLSNRFDRHGANRIRARKPENRESQENRKTEKTGKPRKQGNRENRENRKTQKTEKTGKNRENRENQETREIRENRENGENGENRENRENRETRENRENQKTRQLRCWLSRLSPLFLKLAPFHLSAMLAFHGFCVFVVFTWLSRFRGFRGSRSFLGFRVFAVFVFLRFLVFGFSRFSRLRFSRVSRFLVFEFSRLWFCGFCALRFFSPFRDVRRCFRCKFPLLVCLMALCFEPQRS